MTNTIELDDFLEDDDNEKAIESKIINFNKINSIKFSNKEYLKKIEFADWKDVYFFKNVEESRLESDFFLSYMLYKYGNIYNKIPQHIVFYDNVINKEFFEKLFRNLNIPDDSYNYSHSYDSKGKLELNSFFIHFKELFLMHDGSATYVIYNKELLTDKNSIFYIIMGLIKNYKLPIIQKNKIYVVFRSTTGFKKKPFEVKKRKDIDLINNYNDGFVDISNDIIHKLNNKKKSGLVLLSGPPGSGKTTYIRYLAGRLKRNIIFISPDMVQYITSPEFIPFLMDNSDSILVIEDAEPALQKRFGDERTNAVSNILNMTDGLLSDCLNISIIATFNTNTKEIDEALLRKGRLLKSYKFDKLSIDKSRILLDKIGRTNIEVKGPMTLAEIYFAEDELGLMDEFKIRKTGFNK